MSHRTSLSSLRRRYLRSRVTETLLFSVGLACLAGGMFEQFSTSGFLVVSGAVSCGILLFLTRIYFLQLHTLNELRLSLYLNKVYPQFQESSDLFAKSGRELTALEQIQLKRIESALLDTLPAIRLPHHLGIASGTFVFGIAFLLVAYWSDFHVGRSPEIIKSINTQMSGTEAAVGALNNHRIEIQAPAYTQLPQTSSDRLNVKVPENSELKWKLGFTQEAKDVRIIFSNGDSINCLESERLYQCNCRLREPMLYQVKWTTAGRVILSDYFKIEIKEDQLPAVAITDLAQFTRLTWGEKDGIKFHSSIRDDYGVQQAHIIATVSKGSGESVKFREEKLLFNAPLGIKGRSIIAERIINFGQLGMEPGDEVYFYVEAFDNKSPIPQRNRTETYFISLQDTASRNMSLDAGLGADIMPEYFRSQRQIIIDTEKLLEAKNRISKEVFTRTGNELGYDQKVLRLRYGQFLGEEFETSIGQPIIEQEEEENIVKQFGHGHDTENEHNLVEEKKGKEEKPGHQHNEVEGNQEDPLAAFKHNHDNLEEATFFTQSIKAKLRAALTLMWESELHLRLDEPRKSLPYQFQILKLLKEISQDSRIYVHRMGFDPPPLKEEKRLTGDLAEIRSSSTTGVHPGPAVSAIGVALKSLTETLERDSRLPPTTDCIGAGEKSGQVSEQLRKELLNAGYELAALAIERPGNYLQRLSDIKKVTEGTVEQEALNRTLKAIQETFWNILPEEISSRTRQATTLLPLHKKFLEELNRSMND